MAVTTKQRKVLEMASRYEHGATVRQLEDRLSRPGSFSERFTYDEVHGHLVRLERKGLIRRNGVNGRSVMFQATENGLHELLGDAPVAV